MIIAQISDTHVALDSPDANERIRDFEFTIADITHKEGIIRTQIDADLKSRWSSG